MNFKLQRMRYYSSAFVNAVIFQRPTVSDMPFSISVEASGKCNLNCEYCYHKDWDKNIKREKGLMSLTLFRKFIEEVSKTVYPVNINFDLGGEPFLNPNLMDMVDLACSCNKLTNITTNGTLLTDELIDRILQSRLHKISISVGIVNGANIREG